MEATLKDIDKRLERSEKPWGIAIRKMIKDALSNGGEDG